MIKHKVIELLKKLSAPDIRRLTRFMDSTYFNRSKKNRLLYSIIIKYYPSFDHRNFTKEKIFSALQQSKKYNDSTLRGLMYDLLQMLYKFLVIEGLEDNTLNYQSRLIRELYERQCFGIAKSELRNLDELKQKHRADYDYYINSYLLESYKYNIERGTAPFNNKLQTSSHLSILSASDGYLLLFFITELISDYMNTVIYASKYNLDVSDCTARKIMSAVNLNKITSTLKFNPDLLYIPELYISLFNSFNKINNKSHYLTYRRKIRKYEDTLSRDELTFHYSNLINYLILRQNKKKSPFFTAELFKTYEKFLEREYYLDSKINYLKPGLFRAILFNALECKKNDWMEHFIKIYSDKVPEDSRKNMYHYGYALLYNSLGRNTKALDYIDRIKINNFIFKYDTYNIKLRIYFEYSNPQKALDYIHTYNEYLRKDNFFSEVRKIPYRNFIKFAKDIISCRENKTDYDIDYIKLQLEKTENVINKEWLFEKIAQFKNNKNLQKLG